MVKNAATRLNVRLRNQRILMLTSVEWCLRRVFSGLVDGIEEVALTKPGVTVNEDSCADIWDSNWFVVLAESGRSV